MLRRLDHHTILCFPTLNESHGRVLTHYKCQQNPAEKVAHFLIRFVL